MSATPHAIRHLLIPHAAPRPGEPPELPPLPNLTALLARLRVADTLACDDDSPAEPHELALARAHGLPGAPGRIPWAAFDTQCVGTPCAWLRPVHLRLGMDHIELTAPESLQLTEADSLALMASCAPLLAGDGVDVRHIAPGRWLAQGELLRHLTCASPERAKGQRLTRAQLAQSGDPSHQRPLARLNAELEMLLANHRVNQSREPTGALPVNAVWIHGAGALPQPVAPGAGIRVATQLSPSGHDATATDAAAQTAAWQALDAECAAPLLASLRAGHPVQLTLSGPRQAITLAGKDGGAWARISSLFGRPSLRDLRQQL